MGLPAATGDLRPGEALFNTAHFVGFLGGLFAGGGMEAVVAPGTMRIAPMTQITPGRFLGGPGLWIGLAVTSAFVAATVRVRRYLGPH